MKLEETRFEEASDHLATALQSQWVLDPASSSDLDSDLSRKSLSRKQQGKSALNENDPEEGQLYYSLVICNAAVDDHERAVRCFLMSYQVMGTWIYIVGFYRRVKVPSVRSILYSTT